MKITIHSIEAQITDTSTMSENVFIIQRWVVKYEIVMEHDHVIQGRLNWSAVPNAYKIIKYITWFYGKRNTNTSEQA
jgi:hypothetical protein